MAPRKTASAETADADGEKGPTANEFKFSKAMMENMNGKIDVNWDSVAEAMGLKDAKCAKERYRQMRVKFGWNENGTPARKSGATAAAADPDTPTKVTKVTKRTGKVGSKKTPTKKARGEDEGKEDLEAEHGDDGPAETEDPSIDGAA